jgi:hypothetical protein
VEFKQIETVAIKILKGAKGKFLFPYQIFNRIKKLDPPLGKQIAAAYPSKSGKPIMGKGAGKYYSPATFVAKALRKLQDDHAEITYEWFDANDIKIEGIVPGNRVATSIWAWKKQLK